MQVSKELALRIWNEYYGNKTWVQDCFGTWMHKDDYGNEETSRVRPGNSKSYDYSWNIDHIKPQSKFKPNENPDMMNNYEPMHRVNNQQGKSDDYPSFKVKGVSYQVVKCEYAAGFGLEGYGIIKQSTGERVDWKGVNKKAWKKN